jgi:hypothetical protein
LNLFVQFDTISTFSNQHIWDSASENFDFLV